MRYLLLIYHDEAANAAMSQAEQEAEYADYIAFGEAVRQRGVRVEGEALMPTTQATTVRVRDGRTLTTDGPFAETKEQLGGYYVAECRDLDEAIEVAAMLPGAAGGSIEVRPIVEFG